MCGWSFGILIVMDPESRGDCPVVIHLVSITMFRPWMLLPSVCHMPGDEMIIIRAQLYVTLQGYNFMFIRTFPLA